MGGTVPPPSGPARVSRRRRPNISRLVLVAVAAAALLLPGVGRTGAEPVVPGASAAAPAAATSNPATSRAGTAMAEPSAAGTPSVDGVWTNLSARSAAAPSPRCCMGSAWDAATGQFLVFGGLPTSPAAANNETWAYANGTWRLLDPSRAPPARGYPAMAYDPALGSVILFGGYDPALETYLNDTWVFANGTWSEAPRGPSPPARIGESLVYDASGSDLILFGGYIANTSTYPVTISPANDTWSYTAHGWARLALPVAPSPRAFAQAATCPPRNGLLLFGGTGGAALFNDTWSFSAGAWSPLETPVAPPPTSGGLAAWDPVGGYVVLTGGTAGSSGTFSSASWAYLNGTWENVTTSLLPPGRDEAGGGWDPELGALVEFGGAVNVFDTPELNDTWAYFDPLQVLSPPGPVVADAGTPVALSVAASGGLRPLGVNWTFGDGTNGSGVPVHHTFAVPGVYDVAVEVRDASGAAVNASSTVQVAAYPVAGIVVAPPTPDAGVPAVLTANVSGGSAPFALNWSFPSGPSGTGSTVVHTFSSPGAAVVSLTLRDAAGATLSVNRTLTVARGLVVTVSSPQPGSEVGRPVAFSAAIGDGVPPYGVAWSFGDGAASSSFSPEHIYLAPGNYTVTAAVTDAAGGSTTGALRVEIAPSLGVAEVATPLNTDVGGVVTLLARTTGGVGPFVDAWAYGDGTTGAGPGAVHAFSAPGRYGVTISVTDARGASATATEFVEVQPAPTVALEAGATSAAAGTSLTFRATVQDGRSPFAFTWNFGDGTGASGPSVVHAFAAPGTYRVSVAVTDAVNLSAVASASETIGPLAGARATGLPISAEVVPIIAWGAVAAAVFALVVYRHLLRERGPPPRSAAKDADAPRGGPGRRRPVR